MAVKQRTLEEKRHHEQTVLEQMIRIYCRGKHRGRRELCQECRELSAYAAVRIQKCPFMETKTFCSACRVHCYAPEMRERVRKVMKYAGPRMLFYHPLLAVRHMKVTLEAKKKGKKDVS